MARWLTTSLFLLDDAVKGGHQIDAARRKEIERWLAAEITRCRGYTPAAG